MPREPNGREGAPGRRGCGGRGDTAVVAGQEHRAASCPGGGGSWGRRNARVLITLPVSRADTRWLSNRVQELRATVNFN